MAKIEVNPTIINCQKTLKQIIADDDIDSLLFLEKEIRKASILIEFNGYIDSEDILLKLIFQERESDIKTLYPKGIDVPNLIGVFYRGSQAYSGSE